MNIWEKYETDKTLEEDGAWVHITEDVKFKVRRLNSKKVSEVAKKLNKPYRHMQTIPEAVAKEISRELFALALVSDWEGVTDKKGKKLECTKDNLRIVFDQLPDLVLDLMNYANSPETFKPLEDAEKNLQKS